jgi:hypothetical protein
VLLVVDEEDDLALEHDPGFVLAGMAVHRWRRALRDQLFGEAEGAAAGGRGNLERPQRVEMPQALRAGVVDKASVRGCIFDVDGVLLDSIPAYRRAWAAWATEHGIEEEAIWAVAHGRRPVDIIRAAAGHLGETAALRRFEALIVVEYELVNAIAGAREILEQLRTLIPNEPVHAWLIRAGGRQPTSRSRLPLIEPPEGTASPASARTPVSAGLEAPRRQGSAMDRPLLRRQGPAPWLGCALCWRSPRDTGFRCLAGR